MQISWLTVKTPPITSVTINQELRTIRNAWLHYNGLFDKYYKEVHRKIGCIIYEDNTMKNVFQTDINN